MAIAPSQVGVGTLLRDWRARLRMSQLDLALQAGISQRHLSFLELGRAKPSREMVLRLAGELQVPLRERNALLLASGYAPVYPESPLQAQELLSVRHALNKILTGHEPFPAIVVDRGWDLVWSNEPARALLTVGIAPELLTPVPNAIRVALHPEGLAPRILNLGDYAEHLLARLRRQVAVAPTPAAVALYGEAMCYPEVGEATASHDQSANNLYATLRMRDLGGEELAFFSTVATFGTAVDITVAELSIESFFPADKETRRFLEARRADAGGDAA